eukprot:TRINITY_DN778059_c0_g1_i1.p1 TRINITY_DN778059_c0_g1~~TRINITY_DN778059_c0_g1_i1.p1  ORF type:complete len:174 (+),score=31.79 TRINITY_DN778059_c0_g1_i1:194-715(+)
MNIDEFETLIRERHSVREFSEKNVEEQQIAKILEMSNLAPSAGNLQQYHVFVVKNKEIQVEICEASLCQMWMATAPVILVFVAKTRNEKYRSRGVELYRVQDATIACTYAQLAIEAMGLHSRWVGAFHTSRIQKILGLPENDIPVAILPFGHHDKIYKMKKRLKVSELSTVIE